MLFIKFSLLCFGASIAHAAIPSPTAVGSDLWMLFQNDLDWPTAAEHDSSILLGAQTYNEALSVCGRLNEALAPTNGTFFHSDIQNILAYVALGNGTSPSQKYWVGGGSTSTHSQLCPSVSESGLSSTSCADKLPVLCANSAPNRISNQTDLSLTWQVQVNSGNLAVTGTRDHLSFRFLGIPYADEPARWTYSPPLYRITDYFSSHFRVALRSATSSSKLKPVMFFIHGGAFTGGEGSDSDLDGGNSAIRGDVVVVTINYRLGALGFLALGDGVTNGNYGLADQITALKWVQAHIASFGGDPSRVTIFGQSAGAAAVRALLGSPPAFGLFVGAIAQSNLAGLAYGTTYSEYYTIEQEVEVAAGAFVDEVGCGNGTAADVLACLKAASWQTLQTAPDAPRYLVVDGTYLTRDRLSVDGKGPVASNAHVIFGWMAGDGADVAGSYALSNTTQATSIEGIPIAANLTASILASGLFPRPSTGNETLDTFNVTARIATDGEFRCLDQATAYSADLHNSFESMWTYQFDRSYMGYEPIPGICDPPITPTHPFGDPSLPYFQCHSGELYFTWGNLGQGSLPFRDEFDLPFEQAAVDAWTAFARTYNPNPDLRYLRARGYTSTATALNEWGLWEDVKSNAPVRIWAWPSRGSDGWLEQKQCEILGLPLNFYEH
ncbi:Cholinesterase [Mycena sanguinolenta]|uniref:Carboxylic ester hydrolase n=1 Tax=Mycena sanguinolenta TaxID=230812 RepID=A0A8H7DHA4_9AGAR|nr:Cholinesterase [Mycena sanguinolenta]